MSEITINVKFGVTPELEGLLKTLAVLAHEKITGTAVKTVKAPEKAGGPEKAGEPEKVKEPEKTKDPETPKEITSEDIRRAVMAMKARCTDNESWQAPVKTWLKNHNYKSIGEVPQEYRAELISYLNDVDPNQPF